MSRSDRRRYAATRGKVVNALGEVERHFTQLAADGLIADPVAPVSRIIDFAVAQIDGRWTPAEVVDSDDRDRGRKAIRFAATHLHDLADGPDWQAASAAGVVTHFRAVNELGGKVASAVTDILTDAQRRGHLTGDARRLVHYLRTYATVQLDAVWQDRDVVPDLQLDRLADASMSA